MTDVPRPFVKWAGGKRQLLEHLLPLLPKRIKTYYEPMVGGGAVFFALARERRFERAVLVDMNRELIETYVAIKEDVAAVLHALGSHAKHHSQEYYYEVRGQSPRSLSAVAARMIYLNRTGFNGLYRVNRSGTFNVPFGRYTNPKIVDEENLIACSRVLRDVTLLWQDFETEVSCRAEPGDAVYFDPPYLPVAQGSFTAYERLPFGVAEHERLAKCFKLLRRRKVRVVLTNSSAEETYRLYRGCSQREVDSRRAINSKGDGRGAVQDVIVTGGKLR